MYNSKEYWNKRQDPNKSNYTNYIEDSEIPKLIEDCNSILDIGCGIGRTFKFYADKKVTGVDFSELYRQRAIEEASKHEIDFEHLIYDIHKNDLPFEDNNFDIGITVKVLLHAPQKEMIRILTEMHRVCKKVLLISYHDENKNLAEHCFAHDYISELNKLGYSIEYSKIIKNQIIIVYG